jgi:hypothetical protein
MAQRVLISTVRSFNDAQLIQETMLRLWDEDPGSVVVYGPSDNDRLAGEIWDIFGGQATLIEPNWKKDKKDAFKVRDKIVLDRGADLCISFETAQEVGFIARGSADRSIRVRRIVAGTIESTADEA